MFEHILVAVDFSPAWARLEGQLERLRALGCRRLTLAHVLVAGYTQAPEVGHGPYYEDRLEEMAARLRDRGLEADTVVCAGAVAAELEREARERGAGVILAGSHGHSTLRDMFLGSTVLDLARRARRPLLLAPTAGEVPLEEAPVCRPLLATDGSKAAEAAEEAFLKILPECRRGVVVSVGRWDDDPDRADERRAIETHVEGLAQRAGERGFDTALVGQGKPSVVIGRVAEEKGADLVIIGKRGRNPVTDLLIGSTAEAVCRQARRLTLLVPGGA
ncbi:universal stress protein [Thioalkalivibrio sp.]|uniref:universal stress protein n=1 Tax=Thioalkalivibrio sp. TaxID=2093813 RepID=UPI0012D58DE3|nr:universal stress protein [Thioalkalivibrio sp.]TVP78767.1 MAG: universal stress protein [Thioalkalivibrio sp.]